MRLLIFALAIASPVVLAESHYATQNCMDSFRQATTAPIEIKTGEEESQSTTLPASSQDGG